MAAAPARIVFSSTVEPRLLLQAASPAAGNGRRGHRRRGGSIIICSSLVASETLLLRTDFDLEEGLTNMQKILQQRRKSGREMMAAVDNLKRLCIDHYFEEEIETAMGGACMDLVHSDDLWDATLAFRLMREAGHDVSADDVLRRFTDGNGEFTLALSKDVRGLLSLYDMSHLDMGDEASLHKAKEFSSKHLAPAIRYLEPGLARYVRQSLDHPYHLSLMQYKARHHLSYLQSLPKRNTAMEELAIAEFRLNKLQHQQEMQEIKGWWVDLGLAQEIPVARDQVLKWYMWPMTAIQGSSLSRYRIEITKIISLVYVVDDIFDLVGTPEELSVFTEAVKMSSTDSRSGSCFPTGSCMSSRTESSSDSRIGSSPKFGPSTVEIPDSRMFVTPPLRRIKIPELCTFANSRLHRWNTAAPDSLPSCMRSCYSALYTTTNEIADMAEKEHGFNPVNHLRKAWAVLFEGFMVESKWLATTTDQSPAAEDYLRNAVVTSGVPLTFAHLFFLLGQDHHATTCTNGDAAKLSDHRIVIPPAISCPAKILRLWDDMGSAKDEAQEGLDGSYRDLYLMENPSCTLADAEEHMRRLIAREWEELNRECFSRRTFSGSFSQVCLNAARMVSVMYSYNEEQRLIVLEEYMRMLLL